MKEYIAFLLKKYFPQLYKYLIDKKEGRYDFQFSESLYPGSFLNTNEKPPKKPNFLTEKIFVFWTGNNEMSHNRKKGLLSIREKAEVPVVLVTESNLNDFILENFPLHPAYNLLSLVHRSDYLRCYFMHHYGGGYADVKTFHHSWKNAFRKLRKKNDHYIIGYPEVGGIAQVGGKLYDDLKFHMPLLIGNGAFICKSYTIFTSEWYRELHRRMDYYYDDLVKFSNDEISDYPVPYTSMQGQIFHPLVLKHHKKVLRDKNLMPDFINYR